MEPPTLTLEQAASLTVQRISGQMQAIRAAAQNGKPIVMPDGRLANVQAPHPADLTVSMLQANSVILQYLTALAATLSQGFVLSDPEANRVADLVVERMRKAE